MIAGLFGAIPRADAGVTNVDGTAARLAAALIGRIPHSVARIEQVAAGRGRLGAGSQQGFERFDPLVFVRASADTQGLRPDDILGEAEIGTLDATTLDFAPAAGRPALEAPPGGPVRIYRERHTVALAITGSEALDSATGQALFAALRRRLDSPVMRLVRMPALEDTAEAQQLARAAQVDLFGWLGARHGPAGVTVTVGLLRARDAQALPEVTAPLASDAGSGLVEGPPDDETDPVALLPGCRPAWTGPWLPGILLDLAPRRFLPGSLDLYFDDRIESWRLTGGALAPWQRRPLDTLWPPAVGTRWPVGSLLPVNSYFAKNRSESRVFYAFCSNRRPRYLSISVAREHPDSLQLSVSDGPQDSLNGCAGSCFAQVDRVERIARFLAPAGLPKTAGARLALGRVDLGPSGLPSYDEKGYVKTRKSALVLYDLPGATLWLAAADTAFGVTGRFGDRMDGFRVGRAGLPGLIVTSAAPVGGGDRLQFWVWDDHRLALRWQSDLFRGTITGVQAADFDGDAREDLVVAETRGSGESAQTRLRLYLSTVEPAAEGGTR